MLVYFQTFGCRVNTSETASMQHLIETHGHMVTNDLQHADAVVINSCTVTSQGDHRVLSYIRKLRQAYPDLMIILTGCFVQAYPKLAKESGADFFIGTQNRSDLIQILEQQKEISNIIKDYTGKESFEILPVDIPFGRTRAFLKIQDGCNCFCSYCIIPYARGRCRSLKPESITEQVQKLAQKGCKEVVLCGINIGFYGMEWGGCLADAIQAVSQAKGIERIRLSSLEPEKLSPETLTVLAKEPKFCPQFHISLQSGCDRTLKRMNRRYTEQEYADLCQRLREVFPDCAITTDFMVGFPDETEEDFQNSLEFAKSMNFAQIHVFRYSERPGTPAAKFPNRLPERIRTERMKAAEQVASASHIAFLKSHIGKTYPVLFENEKKDGCPIGHLPDGTLVKISEKFTKKSLQNSIHYVIIEENDTSICYGKLAEDV